METGREGREDKGGSTKGRGVRAEEGDREEPAPEKGTGQDRGRKEARAEERRETRREEKGGRKTGKRRLKAPEWRGKGRGDRGRQRERGEGQERRWCTRRTRRRVDFHR
ncbi:hypothetical protein ACLOJK_019177 [Asimina triloba]